MTCVGLPKFFSSSFHVIYTLTCVCVIIPMVIVDVKSRNQSRVLKCMLEKMGRVGGRVVVDRYTWIAILGVEEGGGLRV